MRNVSVLSIADEPALRAAVAEALAAATKEGLLLVEAAGDASAMQRALREAFSCVLVSASALTRGMRCVEDWVDTAHSPAVIVLAPDADARRDARVLALGAQAVLPWTALRERLVPAIVHSLIRQGLVREMRARGRDALLSLRDPLTGALRRSGLEFVLAEDRAHEHRDNRQVSALFLDCDELARINDTRGAAAGDRVLAEVVSRVRTCLRSHDRIARVGGDEFLVLLPDTGEEHACAVAERIRVAVGGRVIPTPAGAVSLTISIGVFSVHDPMTSVAGLCELGEATLGAARASGATRVARPVGGGAAPRRWPLRMVGADPTADATRSCF